MAFANAKVILLGEHSVVYGRPALASPLARGVHASAAFAATSSVTIETTAASEHNHDPRLEHALRALLNTYATHDEVHVHCRVDLPLGAGLGSSAAMGVASARAINELFNVNDSDAELIERTLAWERIFHEYPSGLDCTVTTLGKTMTFQKSTAPPHIYYNVLSVKTPLHLVFAHVGYTVPTSRMVTQVRMQRDADPTSVDACFDAIGALVDEATKALIAADTKNLGALMTRNHELLRALNVSTSELDTLCDLALKHGALGAKLTGAGGGGCMVALAASESDATLLATRMSSSASQVFCARCIA